MPLVKRKPQTARAAPAPALDAPDAATRRAAALALVGDRSAVPALLAALPGEPAREVQAAILAALTAIRDEAAATGLVALLAEAPAGLRSNVGEALGAMGDVALRPLKAMLATPDVDARISAVEALGRIAAEGARAALREVLATEAAPNVGLAAVEALARIGTPADAPALRGFAARFAEEPMARFAVAVALDRIGMPP